MTTSLYEFRMDQCNWWTMISMPNTLHSSLQAKAACKMASTSLQSRLPTTCQNDREGNGIRTPLQIMRDGEAWRSSGGNRGRQRSYTLVTTHGSWISSARKSTLETRRYAENFVGVPQGDERHTKRWQPLQATGVVETPLWRTTKHISQRISS